MARIVVFNQKGGVGKTTTTLNLAALLARSGLVPLVIDLDPQAHLSAISGTSASDGRDSLYAFYQDAKQLAHLIRASNCGCACARSMRKAYSRATSASEA